MKVRCDFVTNSSSASFLLAFKGKQLTQKQKDAIVSYILKHALGAETTEEDWENIDSWYDGRDWYEQAKEYQKKDDWTVRYGRVDFEDSVYNYSSLLEGLWYAIARADPENTEVINADLSY